MQTQRYPSYMYLYYSISHRHLQNENIVTSYSYPKMLYTGGNSFHFRCTPRASSILACRHFRQALMWSLHQTGTRLAYRKYQRPYFPKTYHRLYPNGRWSRFPLVLSRCACQQCGNGSFLQNRMTICLGLCPLKYTLPQWVRGFFYSLSFKYPATQDYQGLKNGKQILIGLLSRIPQRIGKIIPSSMKYQINLRVPSWPRQTMQTQIGRCRTRRLIRVYSGKQCRPRSNCSVYNVCLCYS